jgi:protease I
MRLKGKRIGMLAEDMYNDMELWVPYYRFLEEGAEVKIIGTGRAKEYKSKLGQSVKVNVDIDQVDESQFDAVVIPGGYAPDKMRLNEKMIRFVADMDQSGKLIAVICHAGWMLASSGAAKNRRVTCCPSIKDDMINAGAQYMDAPVVVDGHVISSRTPADIPDFCRAIMDQLSRVKI